MTREIVQGIGVHAYMFEILLHFKVSYVTRTSQPDKILWSDTTVSKSITLLVHVLLKSNHLSVVTNTMNSSGNHVNTAWEAFPTN